ncbi:MAG TPA: hypothetical protein VFM54_13960 [Micromonosporaceae bacterium]|nr:hypothetical protein [Micromonosporaceae bacterium]
MTTTNVIDRPLQDIEPEPEPLQASYLNLAPGMRTRMDRCVGDVPMVETATTPFSRMVISINVGDIQNLNAEYVAVAEEFATAVCAFRDELRALVAAG